MHNHLTVCHQSVPESAWGAVSPVHVGQAGADHRVGRHLTSLTSQSLQGRVVTVGELKKEEKFFRPVLDAAAGAKAGFIFVTRNQMRFHVKVFSSTFFVLTNIKSFFNALRVKETICGWISLPFLPEIVFCARLNTKSILIAKQFLNLK